MLSCFASFATFALDRDSSHMAQLFRAVVASSLIIGGSVASGQAPAPAAPMLQEPQTILLWPAGAPGALGQDEADKPALIIYMPPNTTGPLTAVIIAPGGGYQRLSMDLEGREPA